MPDPRTEHDIVSETELIGADYINETSERVPSSDVRYHFVLDTGALA